MREVVNYCLLFFLNDQVSVFLKDTIMRFDLFHSLTHTFLTTNSNYLISTLIEYNYNYIIFSSLPNVLSMHIVELQ